MAIKGDEDKIVILERIILRKLYRPKKNDITQQYKVRSNIELQQLYKESDMVAMLQYRRIARADYVWMLNSLMKAVLNGNPVGKTTRQTQTKVDRQNKKEFSRDWNTR